MSNFKIVSGDSVQQSTWPLLLKIELMVKLQVLADDGRQVMAIAQLALWAR
jgi:hypothetical protein